jgi:hypothetical protein
MIMVGAAPTDGAAGADGYAGAEPSGPRLDTGPVVGAWYSPIHSSRHALAYCWLLQRGW